MIRKLDRNSFIPLYVQITSHVLELIKEHEDRKKPFYSDEELAKMFQVNRLTIRRATEELADKGLLYRVRGVGTFVSSPKIQFQPGYNSSLQQQCKNQGLDLTVIVTKFEEVLVPEIVAEVLGLSHNVNVTYLERLRLVNDIPVVLDMIYLPLSVRSTLTAEDCVGLTIPEIVYKAIGLKLVAANTEMEAVLANKSDAETLHVAEGDPLLLRRVTLLSSNDQPVTYGTALNRADLFKYTLRTPVNWPDSVNLD